MALTTLDRQSALIVIDLQKGVLALPAADAAARVLQQTGLLLAAFRQRQLPVVLVRVEGGAPGRVEQKRALTNLPADWSELAPELQVQASDHLICKHRWGAFTDTGLDALLRQLGVTQVVLAGISTSIGVESTARCAHELGYHVTLAIDAMTDVVPEAHTHSVTRIFPRLGETASCAEIIAMLAS